MIFSRGVLCRDVEKERKKKKEKKKGGRDVKSNDKIPTGIGWLGRQFLCCVYFCKIIGIEFSTRTDRKLNYDVDSFGRDWRKL